MINGRPRKLKYGGGGAPRKLKYGGGRSPRKLKYTPWNYDPGGSPRKLKYGGGGGGGAPEIKIRREGRPRNLNTGEGGGGAQKVRRTNPPYFLNGIAPKVLDMLKGYVDTT